MTSSPTASDDPSIRSASRSAVLTPTFCERLRGRLLRLAVKMLWNRDDAEETVQEAFRQALVSGPCQDERRLELWLLRTVANLSLNLRRKRRPEFLTPWVETGHERTPQAQAARVEQLDQLRKAVETLPAQQRIALTLRTMEQMPYERIAEVMNVTASAVRAHVHLARRSLAERLEDQETADGGHGS